MRIARNVSWVGIAIVMTAVLSREARAQAVPYDGGAGPARVDLDLRARDATARAHDARDAYDAGSKSVVAAVALELFVFPGLGSLYAGDTGGAVMTWTGTAASIFLVVYGLSGLAITLPDGPEPSGPRAHDDGGLHLGLLMGGLVLGVATRIFGIYNAVQATDRHNEQLQTILGLTPTLSLATPLPESPNASPTLLPGLTARF
jgi:hypothetical protein